MSDHRREIELAAARHAMHRVRASAYAQAVFRGELTLPEAKQRYEEAMRNYDAIMAASGASHAANVEAMARGAEAIADMLKEAGWHG